MSLGLSFDHDQLAAICQRFHVVKLELFGSRVKGDARPDSDVDLLVTFEGNKVPSFLSVNGFAALHESLEQLFSCDVDLLVRETVEHDRNAYFRKHVLEQAELFYAA